MVALGPSFPHQMDTDDVRWSSGPHAPHRKRRERKSSGPHHPVVPRRLLCWQAQELAAPSGGSRFGISTLLGRRPRGASHTHASGGALPPIIPTGKERKGPDFPAAAPPHARHPHGTERPTKNQKKPKTNQEPGRTQPASQEKKHRDTTESPHTHQNRTTSGTAAAAAAARSPRPPPALGRAGAVDGKKIYNYPTRRRRRPVGGGARVPPPTESSSSPSHSDLNVNPSARTAPASRNVMPVGLMPVGATHAGGRGGADPAELHARGEHFSPPPPSPEGA